LKEFPKLLKEVVTDLREGREPSRVKVERLGILCGSCHPDEKVFAGFGPEDLLNQLNKIGLPGCRLGVIRDPEIVNQEIREGKRSAWVCGNANHVWSYARAENGSIYEINDSVVSK